MDERSITPIIATILLIGLSVASISVVAIVVNNLAPSAAAPMAEFGDILVENVSSGENGGMTRVTFVHKGGGFVYLNELKVVISGRDNNIPPQERSTTIPRSTKRTLKLGDVVEVATPATLGYYYAKDNEVRVAIVHEPTGTVLTSVRTNVSEPADGAEYGFESGTHGENDTQGWYYQTDTYSQGITAVAPGGTVKLGYGSLRCTVGIIWNDTNKSKGETEVNMMNNPPAGITAPVNLNGVIVSAWVYCPPESAGTAENSNGVQIFFKDDSNWDSGYSTWNNIPLGGGWVRIENIVTSGVNFDATRILAVGVKIGTSTNGNSLNDFSGYIYVDGFDW